MFLVLYQKDSTMINEKQVDVWKKCYGQFDTFPSNIQLLSLFRYVFGEWNLVILMQGSSPSAWVFLENLKVNLPLNI